MIYKIFIQRLKKRNVLEVKEVYILFLFLFHEQAEEEVRPHIAVLEANPDI